MARVRGDPPPRSRELLSMAFHVSGAAMLITRLRDGAYIEVNETFLKLTGFAREDLIGKTAVETRVWPCGAEREEYVARLRQGAVDNAERRFRMANGEERVGLISSQVSTLDGEEVIVSSVTDITDLKRAEEALRKERDFSAAVIDTAGALVVVLDRQGRIQRFNRACETLTDFSADEVSGRKPWELGLIAKEELPRVRDAWDALLRGESPLSYETIWIAKDGSRRLISWSNAALAGADGAVESIVCTGVDVTDRRPAEAALSSANLHLRQADRRKNEFLAVLSHELRNPLAPILNSVYLLRHAAPGGQRAARAHDVIERQTRLLSRLVEDLLEVTRITEGKIRIEREALDLGAAVRRTAEDFRHTFASAGVTLRVSTPGTPVWVDADPARITQVIENLLSNAAKFSERDGQTALTLRVEGDRAVVRVRDTGVGIAPDFLARVFEPFAQADRTLDRARGGLGLGLPVLKGIVDLHGGSVAAHSEGPGKGAEFVVTLPLAERSVSPDGERSPTASTVRRILIIEDNLDSAESLRDVLGLYGHTAVIASNGPEGVELARGTKPDIVLCDIGLPGMDGFEVARQLRATAGLGGTKLIALSGYALAEDVSRARAAGFDEHWSKPVDPERLANL